MKNITASIKNSISQNVLWNIEMFYQCVESFKTTTYQISYWEGEENWASILYSGEVVGYIWVKYPLLIATSKHIKNIKAYLKEFPFINFIEVETLITKELEINCIELKDYFDFEFKEKEVSAEDIWFYTNSK